MNKKFKFVNPIFKVNTLRMEMGLMIKKMAWDIFKNTGNINTFLEYKQIVEVEKGIKEKKENGEYKTKWDSDSRK